jgi:hypothetical protein
MGLDWNEWVGKKVFIRTNYNKVYSGVVKYVDAGEANLITIIDKYGKLVSILSNQINEIKEES